MQKPLISLFILVLFSNSLFSQSLKTVKVNDGEIIMKVPKNFVEMIPDDIAQRFPSIRKPIAAYTDEQRQSEQTVKISATQWGNNDQEIAMSFFKASIMEYFDKVEFIKEEMVTIKKKSFIVFEFTSYVRGSETQPSERKYNYLMYYIKDRKTLVVSFRCPQKEMEFYKPVAEEIMNSLKIKKF